MADDAAVRAFAAFRVRVFDDFHLRTWLQAPLGEDAFVQRVVAAGADHGFVLEPDVLRAALREGKTDWLKHGCDVDE